MRRRFLAAAPLAACLVTGASGPAATGVALTCPATQNRQVGQLCQALADALRQSGRLAGGADAAAVRLELAAESPRPDVLIARLTVLDRLGRHEGAPAELSVLDRPTIPEARIRGFAKSMLERAGFPARAE